MSESLVHILTCPDSRSADLRATLLLELHEWLIAELTCPWIREFLFYGLQSWFDDPEGHGTKHSPHRLKPNYPLAGTPPFLDSFMTRWCSYNTAFINQKTPEKLASCGHARSRSSCGILCIKYGYIAILFYTKLRPSTKSAA